MSGRLSMHQPESTFPAGYLQHMSDRVGKMKKSITHGWRSGKIVIQTARRPVDQKRATDDILARHESPEAAVPAVVAIVAHKKIEPLGNNQLVIFDQFRHFL